MFERFTHRARRVVVLSQEEARELSHNWIGTEHLLLCLIREGEGVAARALADLGATPDVIRASVLELASPPGYPPGGHIPLTAAAKRVLDRAMREMLQLGHNYVGTEHLLLGLIHEIDDIGAQALIAAGFELSAVRAAVLETMAGDQGKSAGSLPWQFARTETIGSDDFRRLARGADQITRTTPVQDFWVAYSDTFFVPFGTEVEALRYALANAAQVAPMVYGKPITWAKAPEGDGMAIVDDAEAGEAS